MPMDNNAPAANPNPSWPLILAGFALPLCLALLYFIASSFTRVPATDAAVLPTAPQPVAGKVLPIKIIHGTGFDFNTPAAAWQQYDTATIPKAVGAVLGFEHNSPFVDFTVVMPPDLPTDLSTEKFVELSRMTLQYELADFNVVDESPYTLHGTPGIRLRAIGTLTSPNSPIDGPEMYGVFWFSQWLGHHYCLRIGGPANNATEVNAAAEEMFDHFHPCKLAK
jgi:hypothetical protein